MDPLTSLSLTCAIVQLVDFSCKLIKGTSEIYGSATGATLQDASLKAHTQHLKDLTSEIKHGTSSPSGPLEKNLQQLVGECQQLSDKLLRYLEKTAAKDESLISSVSAAWSSLRYKAAKKELQSQLDSCQNQLELYLNALMRSDIKKTLEGLARSEKSNTDQFASLEGLVKKLQEGVHVSSLDGGIQNQLGELLGLSGKTYDSMRKQRILQSLSFATMHRRIDQVHSAHVGTFDWILREGSFVDWLSHGRGVFHIAGKPGSGKSTLMRFLCYDPRTEERLQQWAAGSRLVRANYFFWRHGESDLQRNLEGLFRGLLHDSLSQCPDLIPDVFPELWEASESSATSWLTDSGLKLQTNQIRHAFYKMINNRDLYCNRRFCFFIDGLDEYKETTREDYGDLVKLLFEWVDLAPRDVKMCVSSRELNIFETGRLNLDSKLKLRLHQLTEKDIETLVRDRLSELFPSAEEENSLDLSSIRQAVIARADGVFLWVTLVLKSLREGWADGDTPPLLLEKVNSTPPELDDLFMELLMSVAGANKQRAYLMMAVALRFSDVHGNMSALFCFFVTEFYTSGFINEKGDVVLNQSHNYGRIATARRRIMAYSKGLLEVVEPGNLGFYPGEVIFAHRSVCDFLKQGNLRNLIQEKVDSSDIHKAICLSYLAELRAVKNPSHCDPRPLLSICKTDWREDMTPYLLDRIDEEICQMLRDSRPEANPLATMDDLWPMFNHGYKWGSARSLTYEAGRNGFLKYIKWKMDCHPSLLDSDEEAVGLFVICMVIWLNAGTQENLRIMEFMLDSRLPPNAPGEGWTIWLLVLMDLIARNLHIPDRFPERCSQLIDIFLLRGAETRISFNYETEDDEPPSRKQDGHFGREFQSGHKVVLFVGKERIRYEVWKPSRKERARFEGSTLRDLIDQLKLPDAEKLKAMVDGSSEDVRDGLGDFTPETNTPQLTEAPRIGSSGKTWAWLFGISGPFAMMISSCCLCCGIAIHTWHTFRHREQSYVGLKSKLKLLTPWTTRQQGNELMY